MFLKDDRGRFTIIDNFDSGDFYYFKNVLKVFQSIYLDEDLRLSKRELDIMSYILLQYKNNIVSIKDYDYNDVLSKCFVENINTMGVWCKALSKKKFIKFSRRKITIENPFLLAFLKNNEVEFSVVFKTNVSEFNK